ncbi:MAG: P-II family nitrogen regulator [Oscillospiraceae bacterium]|nr:P-II family nitrogen regulator [Oscillospiraceae bacterium]
MAGYSLLCCVVNLGDASKLLKVARQHGVKGGTISIGRGTVNNRMLNFLAINEERKEIVTMVIERELAHEALKGISTHMAFEKPHHGIAFSYSVSEFTGTKNECIHSSESEEEEKSVYSVIYVVVDKGRGEEVIDAANQSGARGGTIINARGAGIHEVQKFFAFEIEPEKEEVFILTKTALKDGIVESIREQINIDKPGNGIMFVIDINEVYGLHED